MPPSWLSAYCIFFHEAASWYFSSRSLPRSVSSILWSLEVFSPRRYMILTLIGCRHHQHPSVLWSRRELFWIAACYAAGSLFPFSSHVLFCHCFVLYSYCLLDTRASKAFLYIGQFTLKAALSPFFPVFLQFTQLAYPFLFVHSFMLCPLSAQCAQIS